MAASTPTASAERPVPATLLVLAALVGSGTDEVAAGVDEVERALMTDAVVEVAREVVVGTDEDGEDVDVDARAVLLEAGVVVTTPDKPDTLVGPQQHTVRWDTYEIKYESTRTSSGHSRGSLSRWEVE